MKIKDFVSGFFTVCKIWGFLTLIVTVQGFQWFKGFSVKSPKGVCIAEFHWAGRVQRL